MVPEQSKRQTKDILVLFHSIAYSYDGNTLTIAETDDDDIDTYKVLILTDKVLGIQDSKGNIENFRKQ